MITTTLFFCLLGCIIIGGLMGMADGRGFMRGAALGSLYIFGLIAAICTLAALMVACLQLAHRLHLP